MPRGQRSSRALIASSRQGWLEASVRILFDLGIDIVATETDVRVVPMTASSKQPDLVVLDLDSTASDQGEAVLGCLREVLRVDPDVRVIVFGDDSDQARIETVFAAGAAAYVAKNASRDDIASAIRQVFAPSVHFPLFSDGTLSPLESNVAHPPLTDREIEVLSLIAEGRTNAEVAKALFVTEQTVKFHLSNVYAKLNVANRTQAGRWAHLRGLVPRSRP